MNEGLPEENLDTNEDEKMQERIALALELSESMERINFPGIKSDVYEKIKTEQEEYPGVSTPIDELLERFEREGMKIALNQYSASGNIFILPYESEDTRNDGLMPRQLSTEGDIDEDVLNLILKY